MTSVSLCREANTIFRGNSLATRCIDDMMKIVGRSYLTVTLKPALNEVFMFIDALKIVLQLLTQTYTV